jgi:hypothetical protein
LIDVVLPTPTDETVTISSPIRRLSPVKIEVIPVSRMSCWNTTSCARVVVIPKETIGDWIILSTARRTF